VVLIKDIKEEEYDQEEEDAFNREFAKMLADTTDARKVDRKTAPPVFDTAVPLIRRQQQQQAQQDAIPTEAKANHMQFSLLSKKGNKQQVSELTSQIVEPRSPRGYCVDSFSGYSCRFGHRCQFALTTGEDETGARTDETLGEFASMNGIERV
jgi:hypothetical protein